MELRPLGNTDLKTPPIMFGGNVFGWTLDEKASFRMLDMLLDRGFTFIDTADSYGKETGLSEKIIGRWMKDRKVRQEITLATKAGNVHLEKPDGSIQRSRDNSPAYLQKCIEDSLSRLQTDYIDLFYTHFDDKVTPIKDVLETYKASIESGKIQYIGASNFSEARLKEALELAEKSDLPKYEVFQTEYNLVERNEFESGFGELCNRYKVSTATYFSLASGFLTGKYRQKEDFQGTSRQMLTEKYFNTRGKKVLKALDEISEAHNVSNAGVALAWTLNRSNVTACIASATKESHLDSFEQAINLKLSKEEMDTLNSASIESYI